MSQKEDSPGEHGNNSSLIRHETPNDPEANVSKFLIISFHRIFNSRIIGGSVCGKSLHFQL